MSNDATSQSLALCQSAALGAMGSIIQLEAGQPEQSLQSYTGASFQVHRAANMNNSCEPGDVGSGGFLQSGDSGKVARDFQAASGIDPEKVLAHVNGLALGDRPRSLDNIKSGMESLISGTSDLEKQEKLKATLGEIDDSRGKEIFDELASSDNQNSAQQATNAMAKQMSKTPVAGQQVKASANTSGQTDTGTTKEVELAPWRANSKERKSLAELEASRQNELDELDELDTAAKQISPGQTVESPAEDALSLFERVSHRYKALSPGMSQPTVLFLDRRQGIPAR